VADLAAADREEVLKAWAGLGYYARARNLIKCAEEVVDRFGGRFPDTVEELASLPGIGDYTSAAIAAIAFNRRALVMDGNVERVISRVFAVEMPLPAAKPLMRACLDAITPQERPGDFAQAMMDLGATVCSPRRPACVFCPWRNDCRAFALGDPEPYPFKAPKKEKPVRLGAAFIALDDADRVLLRKRGEKGLLGGMTEVPTTDWTARQDGATDPQAAPFEADWQEKGMVTHVFTHFELRLTIYLAKIMQASDDHGWWEPVANLDGQALPTVMKKAIAVAIGEKRQR
jgi:A/G-specific adenine glycosylase